MAKERVAYYSKMPPNKILHLCDTADENWQETLIGKIKSSINTFKENFFMFSEKKGDMDSVNLFLKEHPEYGTWRWIRSENTSRKKNKRINLYHFVPAHPNIDEWHDAIPELPADNIIKNGDFEIALSGKQLESRLDHYRSVKATSYSDTQRILPANWWFDIGPWNSDNPSDMRLCTEKALAGQYSLYLDSLHTKYQSGFYSDEISKQKKNCLYSFFIRNLARQKAQIWIQTRTWMPKDNSDKIWDNLFLVLDANKTYRIHNIIDISQIKSDLFKMTIICNGRVLLDQFSLITEDSLKQDK